MEVRLSNTKQKNYSCPAILINSGDLTKKKKKNIKGRNKKQVLAPAFGYNASSPNLGITPWHGEKPI